MCPKNVKNITFVAIGSVLSSSKCNKSPFRLGSAPDHAGVAYDGWIPLPLIYSLPLDAFGVSILAPYPNKIHGYAPL